MSDDENSIQNLIPEKNSIPSSLQEPTEPALENTAHSEPSEALPEAPESSPNDFSVKSIDIPPSDSILLEQENEPKTEEKSMENEPVPELISEPIQVSEPIQAIESSDSTSLPQATAQIPPNEPLALEPELIKQEPVSSLGSNEVKQEIKLESVSIQTPVIILPKNSIRELLNKAKNAIQFRKRKKLNKVMSLFLKKSKITNDEVEKFLHISDATATRYLSQLKKEGKIKQNGKTGKGVSYSKI
ncbi:MAG: hypothetical protein NT161_01455 [Candidatus Nomurabacteria bacterium]|nr:hypothetical protein [Candidatus Nomurabacteria bacterium]